MNEGLAVLLTSGPQVKRIFESAKHDRMGKQSAKGKSELFEPLLIPKIDEDELLFLNQAVDQIDVDWLLFLN